MKHADAGALVRIAPLLADLRAIEGLKERTAGVFYFRSRAFLHFHDHRGRLYADVRLDGAEFVRLPATTVPQQRTLLRRIRAAVAG